MATTLFDGLKEHLKEYTLYYSTHNGEYFINTEKHKFSLDFYIKELNIAIEFNGDVWHGNPELFSESDNCHPRNKDITVKELWDRDKYRNDLIKKQVKDIIIVWENDYKKDGIDKTVEKILEQIKY